jgi:hypothetical protein
MPKEVKSRTFRTTNAHITVHEYSAGTLILNVTSVKEAANHAAIWISPDEIEMLGAFLSEFGIKQG